MEMKNKADEEKEDTKVKNSKYHTLFEENVSENKEQIKVKGETLYKIKPAYKKYRLFIDSFAEEERGLHEIFNILWNASDTDELELRVNSWGGIIKEGQSFYNIIKNKFNGRTTTILDSAGYSMGALAFCMGDKRVAMEQSDLMFHDYSGFAWGKGQEIESQVEHNKRHLRHFFNKVIVSNGFLTSEEFEQMIIGKDFWMEVPEMCKRGIATHVMVNGKEIRAKKYLKQLSSNKNAKDVKKKQKQKQK